MFYISSPTFFRPDNTGPYTTLLNFTKKLDIDPCLISLGYFFVVAKFWKLNVCSRVKPPQRCPPRGDPSMHEIWMKKEGSKRWMMRWEKKASYKNRQAGSIEIFPKNDSLGNMIVINRMCIVYSDLFVFCLIGTSSVIGY